MRCSTCHKEWPAGSLRCPDDDTPLRVDRDAPTSLKKGKTPAPQAPATIEFEADTTSSLPPPKKDAAKVPVGSDSSETEEEILKAGAMCGEYKVQERIGAGGMGSVYRGLHSRIGKKVAIKVLARKLSADVSIVQRFVTEARAVNQIGHVNIVDIFADGMLPDGRPYLVMELLEGQTLKERIFNQPRPTMREAIEIMTAVCSALSAAHDQQIVHRDLKPDNIFISRVGSTVKLLDFGIAKILQSTEEQAHTETGMSMGTPTYMAPEQCLSKPVDARTDIYALGVILFVTFTGNRPFSGASSFEIFTGHVTKNPPKPSTFVDMPAELEQLILDCLQKEPENRPQTTREISERLKKIVTAMGRAADERLLWKGEVNAAFTPMSTQSASLKGELTPSPSDSKAVTSPRGRGLLYGGVAVAAIATAVLVVLKLGPQAPPLPSSSSSTASGSSAAGRTTKLQIIARPTLALVTLDGKQEGIRANDTGSSIYSVPVGKTVRVRIEANGYLPAEETVNIKDEGNSIELTMKPQPIDVTVKSNVTKPVTWKLDGEALSSTEPTLRAALVPGPHVLLGTTPGQIGSKLSFELKPGQTAVELSYEFKAPAIKHPEPVKPKKKRVDINLDAVGGN